MTQEPFQTTQGKKERKKQTHRQKDREKKNLPQQKKNTVELNMDFIYTSYVGSVNVITSRTFLPVSFILAWSRNQRAKTKSR